jgi:hypothetical protein
LALRRLEEPTGLAPHAELRELLHDADEGLLGFDPISVIKPFLGDGFHTLAGNLQQVIFQRYGLTYWNAAEKVVHKKADRLAAASEAVYVAGWSAAEVKQVLKIPFKPLKEDPLHAIYGGTPWEPWSPPLAAERFLKELQRIKKYV